MDVQSVRVGAKVDRDGHVISTHLLLVQEENREDEHQDDGEEHLHLGKQVSLGGGSKLN